MGNRVCKKCGQPLDNYQRQYGCFVYDCYKCQEFKSNEVMWWEWDNGHSFDVELYKEVEEVVDALDSLIVEYKDGSTEEYCVKPNQHEEVHDNFLSIYHIPNNSTKEVEVRIAVSEIKKYYILKNNTI